MKYLSVILLAGGCGRRIGGPLPKQFLPLQGQTVASYSLNLFLTFPQIKEIIIVCDSAYRHLFHDPLIKFADPGKERQDSVWNGASLASSQSERLIIHDSARPFLTAALLNNLLQEAENHLAVASAVPIKATIKQTTEDGFVEKTLNRDQLWEMHTPQIIEPALYKKAALFAKSQNLLLTDDVALVELLGHPVKLVKGSYKNIKITTPEDLSLAETFLHAQV
ncbi:MAG: 2-C-methyl-D-erythritol 4-phosphate cytidylyltransferase [Rhabdochlamydiaceae bacterium]|jgi:2-C-methyl-D-erythritol 4-phosphate cytidylyltransferase